MARRTYPAATLEGQRTGPDAWRTVSYYSEPGGRAFGFVIIFGVLAFLLLCLAIGIVWLTQLQSMWVLILFAGFGLVGFLFLVPYHFRHSQEGIDLARIAAERDVDLARTNSDYGVQVIQAQALLTQAQAQMRQIEAASERVMAQPAQSDRNRLSTYVAPEPEDRGPHWVKQEPLRADRMVAVMLEWAREVYEHVRPDGKITTPVPWAERGSLSKPDKRRAQEWLRVGAHMQGRGWIVEYRQGDKSWYLNTRAYPEPPDLLGALSATPPPRGADNE